MATKTTLADCPVGSFLSEDQELCLKTEYGNNDGRIDAYIASSGEFFWGPSPQTIENQRRAMVTPLGTESVTASALTFARDQVDDEAHKLYEAIAEEILAWARGERVHLGEYARVNLTCRLVDAVQKLCNLGAQQSERKPDREPDETKMRSESVIGAMETRGGYAERTWAQQIERLAEEMLKADDLATQAKERLKQAIATRDAQKRDLARAGSRRETDEDTPAARYLRGQGGG